MCPCVGVEDNVGLTNAQEKLLLWHWKLGINMHQIHELMHVHTAKEPDGKHSLMPTVIKSKCVSTSSCPFPKCTSCELANAKKYNPQVVGQHAVKK